MAEELTGNVELKRIHEFLTKVLNSGGSDNSNYKLLIDSSSDNESFNISISDLEGVILLSEKEQIRKNTIYRPTTEPVLVSGSPDTVTIDLVDYSEAIIEPRYSSSTRTIPDLTSFDLLFSNWESAECFALRFSFTGTITIQMPDGTSEQPNVKVSNAGSLGSWDDVTKILTISANTDSVIEFNFEKDKDGSFFDLGVGGEAV